MATYRVEDTITLVAGSGLESWQGRLVGLDATGRAVPYTDANPGNSPSRPVGVLLDRPKAGEACLVQVRGVALILAGGPLNVGDDLMPESQGRVLPLGVVPQGSYAWTVGKAMTSVGNTGDYVEVELFTKRVSFS
ncbi:MAG: hypothetical protein D6816_15360, partial [Bacteroidetes bacterium]